MANITQQAGRAQDRTQSVAAQRATLVLLRVTLGMLLVWWGLAKIINVGFGSLISDTFYGGAFSMAWLQIGFGIFEVVIGLLVVIGLFRWLVLPIQAIITGFTAAAVWYAIIDPFKWYLPAQTEFPHTQLFYPSAIIFAASLLLIAFRDQDRLALDAPRG